MSIEAATAVEQTGATLKAHGQEHLLAFFDAIPPRARASLLGQISQIDFDEIDRLIDGYVRRKPQFTLPGDLEPAPFYPNHPGGAYDPGHFRTRGEEIVRSGRVAAFIVAGGQGTRLGWNGPKGTFPATPVEGKPLFRVFAEQIRAAQDRWEVTIPWYIMTSPQNDDATRAFFADNNNFGLKRRDIFMFPQGVMPSFDKETAKILLAEKDEIAMNPDGHGGSLRALARSGALEDMRSRGVEHISYFQVDNPLARVIDPTFVGLHSSAPDSSGEMSSKMVPKAYPEEKMGVFCRAGGKTMIIEYSDLPHELAHESNAYGRLRFIGGSIAIHILGVDFVERLTSRGEIELPWHRAEKKVSHIDIATGRRTDPAQPNAVKLETFVFDAIPLAESSIVYETSRLEEFAPIKNADGVDSAATSRQIQSDRNAAWLESRGVSVPRDADGHARADIEISPLTALFPEDLEGIDHPAGVEPGERIRL